VSFNTTLAKAIKGSTKTLVNGKPAEHRVSVYKDIVQVDHHRISAHELIYVDDQGYAQVEVEGSDDMVEFQFLVQRGLEPLDIGQLCTNTDLVRDLMEGHSKYGALVQMFVIEAIRRYVDECAEADPSSFGQLVNGEAWKGVAREVKERCEKFYNRHVEEKKDAD
jgi:hypothetical protein